MRLFVAIELEERARTALAEAQVRVARGSGAQGLRFVPASRLHLTLAFIGEVDRARAAALVAAMEADVEQAPYTISFGELGVFPPHGPTRILWIGVREGRRETLDVHATIVKRLSPLGFTPEARPFWPHLTLARWARGDRPGRLHLDGSARTIARTRVDVVRLFESRPSPTGPTYTALATANLRCSTASSSLI